MEKLQSEVTVILALSQVTTTESPSAPALSPTLILSWGNFSREAMSMILSSTGFARSITKLAPFFFPFAPHLTFATAICRRTLLENYNTNRVSIFHLHQLLAFQSSKRQLVAAAFASMTVYFLRKYPFYS